MRNRYLEERARIRRDMARGRNYRSRNRAGNGYINDAEVQYQMGMRDGRNPYGSRGGYVRDSRGNDYGMDYRYDNAERSGRNDYGNYNSRNADYHLAFEYDREYLRPMNDYRGRDYNDYNYDRDYNDMEKEYKEELEKWIKKLEKYDTRIKVSKQQIFNQARNMNIKFDDFTEEEFYATYLMQISDYPNITNDYNVYIGMAKNWLMDKDAKKQGSEKLCTYLYEIVLGKSKEEDD